jgi:hypothetical protein
MTSCARKRRATRERRRRCRELQKQNAIAPNVIIFEHDFVLALQLADRVAAGAVPTREQLAEAASDIIREWTAKWNGGRDAGE